MLSVRFTESVEYTKKAEELLTTIERRAIVLTLAENYCPDGVEEDPDYDGVYLLPWRGDEYLITYKYHQVKTSDSDQIIVILLAITTPNNRGIKIKKFIKGVAVGSGVARGIEKLWEIVKEIF